MTHRHRSKVILKTCTKFVCIFLLYLSLIVNKILGLFQKCQFSKPVNICQKLKLTDAVPSSTQYFLNWGLHVDIVPEFKKYSTCFPGESVEILPVIKIKMKLLFVCDSQSFSTKALLS